MARGIPRANLQSSREPSSETLSSTELSFNMRAIAGDRRAVRLHHFPPGVPRPALRALQRLHKAVNPKRPTMTLQSCKPGTPFNDFTKL